MRPGRSAVVGDIACAALVLLRHAPAAAVGRRGPVAPRGAATALSHAARRILVVGFAVSGLTAMMYQIAWTRALIMSLGSSTYSFTCILAAFILGLALGSLAIARWVDRWGNPLRVFGVLELLIGLVAIVIVPLHGQIPRLMQSLVAAHADNFDMLLRVEFLLVTAVTIVPTLLLGAIFPLVTRALRRTRAQDLAQRGAPGGEAAELLEALRLQPGHLPTALGAREALSRAGRGGDAAREFDALLAEHPDNGAANYVRALLAVQAQDHDAALARLALAVRSGAVSPAQLVADDAFATLRADPRFHELLTPGSGR